MQRPDPITVNLQKFLLTKTGTRLAMALSAALPRRPAHAAVRMITQRVAHKDSPLTRTIRANLSVVLDTSPTDPNLDEMVAEVLYHSGTGSYDFFRTLGKHLKNLDWLVPSNPALYEAFEEAKRQGRGMLLIAPHLSAQDVGGLRFIESGYEVQVLSAALPPGGYEVLNGLRETEGLILTPSSARALREAGERLSSGGFAFTSIDRPPPPRKKAQWTTFFGRPARLWNGFAKLAVDSDALVTFAWMERLPDTTYRIRVGETIDPRTIRSSDKVEAVWHAALRQAESAIAAHPEQWVMFFPVWPKPEELP